MKVVAFNASPRKDGNTAILIGHVLAKIEASGIEDEVVSLAEKQIRGCKGCYKCIENLDRRCAVTSDDLNHCIEKMLEADAIILGSPTYFADVSTEMKALIDRAGLVAKVNGSLLRRKLGAAVVATRRSGGIHALDTMNHFFLLNEMIIPGSIHSNMGVGGQKGDVEQDTEGIETMKNLGENMAWLLERLR